MTENGAGALYDTIGQDYDTTRRADPGIVECLVRHLRLDPGSLCLDVACGTGNYALALAGSGVQIVGVDLSRTMLSAARAKCNLLRMAVADAVALPFPAASFQAAVCILAVHHFGDPTRVFAEVRRVMRSGRFVVFTATAEQMRGYWLSEYFPRAMSRSIEQMPSLDFLRRTLEKAGFRFLSYEPWAVPHDLNDNFLYSGKHWPDRYLDPGVRKSISTFANLAEPTEIATGLERLRCNIASGRIDQVTAAYENDHGDYGFAIAELLGG